MIALKVVKGAFAQQKEFDLEVGESKVIGRSKAADIQIPSKDISKTHCKLTVLPGGRAEVVDLGSSNGTYVNGVLVKRHSAKPGDYIGVGDYLFQLGIRPPKYTPGTNTSALDIETPNFGGAASPEDIKALEAPKNLSEKINVWLEANVFPWADKLSRDYDIRFLFVGTLLIWTIAIIAISVFPFYQQANKKIQEESTQVAHLFARQLARLNQQAVIDERFSDLIATIDARSGQTPGVINSYIFDAVKGIILAPANIAGNNLPNQFAVESIQKNGEWAQIDTDGMAYVSAPIKIATSSGTSVAAVAFVEYDTLSGVFKIPAMLDALINALMVAAILSTVILLLFYRWIEGPISGIRLKLQEATLKNEAGIENIDMKWSGVQKLITDLNTFIGRVSGQGVRNPRNTNTKTWSSGQVDFNLIPAASFDSSLVVTGWNNKIESLLGIRSHIAVGNDISGASRDLAFENAVRSLAEECLQKEFVPLSKKIEMSGNPYSMMMIYGQGEFYMTVNKEEAG
ncbi:MAG: FHA domain-containing protein [Proteobacteria bacterium]|nr:FHA domain-containing protein [Pseudomonadota bacterium]